MTANRLVALTVGALVVIATSAVVLILRSYHLNLRLEQEREFAFEECAARVQEMRNAYDFDTARRELDKCADGSHSFVAVYEDILESLDVAEREYNNRIEQGWALFDGELLSPHEHAGQLRQQRKETERAWAAKRQRDEERRLEDCRWMATGIGGLGITRREFVSLVDQHYDVDLEPHLSIYGCPSIDGVGKGPIVVLASASGPEESIVNMSLLFALTTETTPQDLSMAVMTSVDLLRLAIPNWQRAEEWVGATWSRIVDEGGKRAKSPREYDFELTVEERDRYDQVVIALTYTGDVGMFYVEVSSLAWVERTGETIPEHDIAEKAESQGTGIDIVSSAYRVVEQNEWYWKVAWLVTVRNTSGRDFSSLTVTVKFLDRDGFVLERTMQFVDGALMAGETTTLREFIVVPVDTARQIESAEILVKGT